MERTCANVPDEDRQASHFLLRHFGEFIVALSDLIKIKYGYPSSNFGHLLLWVRTSFNQMSHRNSLSFARSFNYDSVWRNAALEKVLFILKRLTFRCPIWLFLMLRSLHFDTTLGEA